MPNGIPLPNGPANHERGTTFLLLTRLTVEKGVRVVLQAIAALPRTLDFQLVVAGRGPLEDEMRQAAADDPRIRFVGYVTGEAEAAALGVAVIAIRIDAPATAIANRASSGLDALTKAMLRRRGGGAAALSSRGGAVAHGVFLKALRHRVAPADRSSACGRASSGRRSSRRQT